MHNRRYLRLVRTPDAIQGDRVFGVTQLVSSEEPPQLSSVKRVAILTEAFLPKVDGVTKTTYLTIRYLQETGREVLVFAPDISVGSVGASEVVALPSVGVPSHTETRMALPHPLIAKRLEAFQPDLIHLCSPAFMTVSGMAVGREMNIPVIANYQTDLPGYTEHYGAALLSRPLRSWLRYLHNGCHINLVPSQTIKRELQDWGYRRLRVWGRGVNLDRFNPALGSDAMRKKLLNGRDPKSLLVIYVGRLAREKRVDLLRDVAALPDVALTIIGDGDERDELEQCFAGTDTHFTGYMMGSELAEAFASADIFCFPGPVETFGQVVQEAMASALPTVVTNQGSVGDLVHQGSTGFVVEHNAESFANAVQHLRDYPRLREAMAAQALKIAQTRPWSAMMQQLEAYYGEAHALNERFKRLHGRSYYHNPFAIGARLQHWGMMGADTHHLTRKKTS